MPSSTLLEAVAVTAELCGRVFSEPAARVFVADLAGYPEAQVLKALQRCRKEVRGVLTVADVVGRIDDGRPGPDEAWSMLPRSEQESVVWTDEMAAAYGACSAAMAGGDQQAARMAFREAYKTRVDVARSDAVPVRWTPCLGWDARGRDAALEKAVQLGRLSYEHAARVGLSLPPPSNDMLRLVGSAVRAA
jgi:hypothetical protein